MEGTIIIKSSKREIVIGVTGHRWIEETREVLAAIDHVIEKIHQTYPDHNLTVLSPLAQGADRVVAKRLLRHQGTKLTAILPLPIAQYLTDFPSDESKIEFHRLLDQAGEIIELPHPTSRDEAYAAVGKYILDQCDLLIAIWDGQIAKGKGGTGEIVRIAREQGLPLAWILHVQKDQDVGERVVRIRFERFSLQNSAPGDGEN
ncbi:MAG TPA: hypothetical protein G4O14_04160 [Anaerolineae bacterium]|nr:hypothetical protein [Anaerolineae bacterium]